jgi:anti-anti-sigma regulatory factor
LTYRIQRSVSPDAVVFVLSGEVDSEHVARLRELLVSEGDDRVVLDLQDVTLVDRDAVRFLAGVEGAGIRVVNCPEYVRSWIAAEKDAR